MGFVDSGFSEYIFPAEPAQVWSPELYRQMKKFKKEILREGFYLVNDGNGGRVPTFISRDRLQHWANQHAEMTKLGLKVPAPDYHSKKAIPDSEDVVIGSKDNYGFWDSVTIDNGIDEQGNPYVALNGILDVPVEADAEKIGKSVQEVSVYAPGKFVDGKGREWNDALAHIAVVTRPVEPGQKNFEPVEGAVVMALSDRIPIAMSDDIIETMSSMGSSNNADIVQMLREVAGISIPDGTTPDRFMEALYAALLQKKQCDSMNDDGGSVTKPPSNSDVNGVPVLMAQNQPTNQTTTAPVQTQETAAQPDPIVMSLQAENAGLKNVLLSNKKSDLTNRLNTLKQRNLVDDATATNYQTQIDGIQMSFDSNNQLVTPGIEQVISALESVQLPTGPAPVVAMANDTGSGFVIQPNNMPTGNGQMTNERADEIVNSLLSRTSA